MERLTGTVRRELGGAGAVDALVLALLVSAMYAQPIAGGGPWVAALVACCLAGAWRVVRHPQDMRLVPAVLVAYVLVYLAAGLHGGFGGGSEVGRYIVRPCALIALSLLLTTPAIRRRALIMVVVLALPEVLFTAAQALSKVVRLGSHSTNEADLVTGTFGANEAGTVTLVALAACVVVVGLRLAGELATRPAAALSAGLLAVGVFTSTRATVVFIPVVALALVAGAAIACGRSAPWRSLATILAVAALAVPATYASTELIFPGAFEGAVSNQQQVVLEGNRGRGGGGGGAAPSITAQLPGRFEQTRTAVRLSDEDGAATALLGRGMGASEVPPGVTNPAAIPPASRTGAVWIGRVLTETGWLGLAAFAALLVWLTALGVRLVRRAADPTDRALGFALPALAALTAVGATYTTVLDVRGYSAAFIVIAAAGIAAARSPAEARR